MGHFSSVETTKPHPFSEFDLLNKTYYRVFICKTGATYGAGYAYHLIASEICPQFLVGFEWLSL